MLALICRCSEPVATIQGNFVLPPIVHVLPRPLTCAWRITVTLNESLVCFINCTYQSIQERRILPLFSSVEQAQRKNWHSVTVPSRLVCYSSRSVASNAPHLSFSKDKVSRAPPDPTDMVCDPTRTYCFSYGIPSRGRDSELL